jgi:hypothetical protein
MKKAKLDPPMCPRCGESDRVRTSADDPLISSGAFCYRCLSYVEAGPEPGKAPPDFEGTPLAKPKRPRKAKVSSE